MSEEGSERIAVVGAGLMGHGIAQVFAVAGHAVTITDPDAGVLAGVRDRVADNLEALGGDPGAAERIEPRATLAEAVRDAQFVFEAVPEVAHVKQEVFAELDRAAPSTAILATNTSVIPVGTVGARIPSSERVVGTHWWNPPYLVPLVEVVGAKCTAPETVDATLGLLERAGKDPVRVERDTPGFVGNRLQHAMWREAIALVDEGVCDAETVDRVVKSGFGPRLAVMGPLETADLIGLDLTLDIHKVIIEYLDRSPGPARLLREHVDRGDLGMKTGQGFRSWTDDAPTQARNRLLRHLSAAT